MNKQLLVLLILILIFPSFAFSRSQAESRPELIFEVGRTIVNNHWKKINLNNNFQNPVVISGPLSYNNDEPAHIRIRNVCSNSFEIKIEECRYLDGKHPLEKASYIVLEQGLYDFGELKVEIGELEVNHLEKRKIFSQNFAQTPVLFSQAQTYNGKDPVISRNNVDKSGFSVLLQEEESGGLHSLERVGYLAIDPGMINYRDFKFEIGSIGNLNQRWKRIFFDENYLSPFFLANIQTLNGLDTAGLRYTNLTDSSVKIKIEEEKSKDPGTLHTNESLGYLVISKVEDFTGCFYNCLTVPQNHTVYSETGYYVWDPQLIFDNGYYYLVYSRWSKSSGWSGYRTAGEVAVARSDEPTHGFIHQAVILKPSLSGWDDGSVNSVQILKDGINWRLFYTGFDKDSDLVYHKQIGVATTSQPPRDWNLNSFIKSEKNPIIPAPGFDGGLYFSVSNPAPLLEDGAYKLWYKTEKRNENGVTRMLSFAKSASWNGPYNFYGYNLLFNSEESRGVEDYFVWKEGNKYRMVLKNVDTLRGEWYQSGDGISWSAGPTGLIAYEQEMWGSVQLIDRPFVYFDQNGLKKYLFVAKKTNNGFILYCLWVFSF